MSPHRNLFWRALFAFLALPGVVAFGVPWALRPRQVALKPIGYGFLALGTTLLVWCVRDFYVAGRGTLGPWPPPKRLVSVGLYRVSRNPMYVAVLTILLGWAIGFGSARLWIYATVVAIAIQRRIVYGEEPWLAAQFPEDWPAYRRRVGRWVTIRRGID